DYYCYSRHVNGNQSIF
nr:immunoglobulin light chain junction region [Macaca mulatta]